MKYITGMHALNCQCRLDTCGDWHASALQWENLYVKESSGSIWGDYGIEPNKKIPNHARTFAVANHIRALLDLIDDGKFDLAQGAKNDFICNDKYTTEFFSQVIKLKNKKNWEDIYNFMHKEYGKEWRLWIEENIKK